MLGRERRGRKQRKGKDTEGRGTYTLWFSHSFSGYLLSTYLLGASHRARQRGCGGMQRRQCLYFYKTYLVLGEVSFQRVTMSHSKSQIVISAMKETNERLREPLSRLGREGSIFKLCDRRHLLGGMNCPFLEQGTFWKKEEEEAGKA